MKQLSIVFKSNRTKSIAQVTDLIIYYCWEASKSNIFLLRSSFTCQIRLASNFKLKSNFIIKIWYRESNMFRWKCMSKHKLTWHHIPPKNFFCLFLVNMWRILPTAIRTTQMDFKILFHSDDKDTCQSGFKKKKKDTCQNMLKITRMSITIIYHYILYVTIIKLSKVQNSNKFLTNFQV